MHNLHTEVRHDTAGLPFAETVVPLAMSERQLRITTRYGYRGRLTTTAVCLQADGLPVSYTDYFQTLANSQPEKITPGLVLTQHTEALKNIDRVIVECMSYYEQKKANENRDQ
jgi:hypothetical protein